MIFVRPSDLRGTLPPMRTMVRGERLAWARERAGYDQVDVAKAIGVSESSVQRWEKCDINARGTWPNGSQLLRLADLLGVSPRWLEWGEGAGPAAKAQIIDRFLESDEGRGLAEDLQHWLRAVPPPRGVEPDLEWVRGLVSTHYRAHRTPPQEPLTPSEGAAAVELERRARRKKS
jgi:transcriptional regulator with XRE-family HTH domain